MNSIFYVLKPDGLLLFSLMRKVNNPDSNRGMKKISLTAFHSNLISRGTHFFQRSLLWHHFHINTFSAKSLLFYISINFDTS